MTKARSIADIVLPAATQAGLDGKQATLVSGTNIKTINGATLLGSGDMTITTGASSRDVDGGSASTVYLATQLINGGNANG